jgi:phosphatidylinositol 4-phosphatase
VISRFICSSGLQTIINLAEQHGKEGSLTTAYRDYVGELGNSEVQYNEYDFHNETKGMKYENISKLINQMAREFEHQG